jgi:hypothetical protein
VVFEINRNIFLLTLFIFLLTFSFADCEINFDKVERMDLSYTLLPLGDADMTLVMVVDYSKECLINRFIQNSGQDLNDFKIEISSPELECPSEFLENYVDKELGNFSSPLTCITTFILDETKIRMNFTGTAINLVKKQDDKFILNIGGGFFFSNLPSDSSITINVPSGAKIVNYFPKSGEKITSKIYWSPAPAEIIQVEYILSDLNNSVSIEKVFQDNLIIIIGVFVGLIVLIMLILARILRVPTPESIKNEPNKNVVDEIMVVKQKIQALEKSYMKGQMDETTYRRLMEQYQLQLNDLRIGLKKQNN